MRGRLHHLLVYTGICILFLIPLFIISGQETSWSLYTLLRIAALWGFISLSIGITLNLLKRKVKSHLGKPFLKIHHYFVIAGLVFVTMHPVLFAYIAHDFRVFIPDISSWDSFFATGGRTAILLFYAAFLAGLFRMTIKKQWKYIHMLVYPAIIIAAIHAILMGQSMTSPVIFFLIICLTIFVCITFVYVRIKG